MFRGLCAPGAVPLNAVVNSSKRSNEGINRSHFFVENIEDQIPAQYFNRCMDLANEGRCVSPQETHHLPRAVLQE